MKTTHNLPFEVAEWEFAPNEYKRFRIGTCTGLWTVSDKHYEILAVVNSQPGNGHFDDVLEWFESSCRRDKKALKIAEVWNKKLKLHLLKKRGFVPQSQDNVIKSFK